MRHSKKLTRLLLVLLLAIWGTVLYRIYASMIGQDAPIVSAHLPSNFDALQHSSAYVYVNDVRDPFRYVVSAKRDSTMKHAAIKPQVVWTPPPYKLSGILLANKKKTVMLEGPNGAAFFLHEGDTLSGVKILKIKEKVVSYFYQKKKTEWMLENP